MKNKILYYIFLYIFSLFMAYNVLFRYVEYKYFGIGIIILSVVLFFGFFLLLSLLKKVRFKSCQEIRKREFIVYFLLIVTVLGFCFIGNCPFLDNNDLNQEIDQVMTGKYGNWHPVFYAVTMIRTPYLLFHSLEAIVLYQLIFVVAILLYFCYFLRKYFLNFKGVIIILLLMLFNPVFAQSTMLLHKDAMFSFCMMLGTMFLIEIYLSDGDWLKSRGNRILFIIMSICIGNFRHNGIANFILMMILLIIFYKKHRRFLILTLVLLTSIRYIITGPIFERLHIWKNGGLSEVMGIPLNQISYIYNNGKQLSDEQLELMDQIAPLENWRKYYVVDNFNMIKWNGNYSILFVKDNISSILKMSFDLAIKYPAESLDSFLNVTYILWGIDVDRSFMETMIYRPELLTPSNYENYDNKISIILYQYYEYLRQPVYIYKTLVLDVGNSFCYLLFSLFIIWERRRGDWKKFIPYVLPISNTLLIMCVIFGGDVRLVLSSLLCFYPLIIFALSDLSDKKKLIVKRKG